MLFWWRTFLSLGILTGAFARNLIRTSAWKTHQHVLMIEGKCTIDYCKEEMWHAPIFPLYLLTCLTLLWRICFQTISILQVLFLFFGKSSTDAYIKAHAYNHILAVHTKLSSTFSDTRPHMYNCLLKLGTKLSGTFLSTRLHAYNCLLKQHTKTTWYKPTWQNNYNEQINFNGLKGGCCDLWVADEFHSH